MKRNKPAMIAMIIGFVYIIAMLIIYSGGFFTQEDVGFMFVMVVAIPQTIAGSIAVIMNTVGYLKNSAGFMLTAALLYTLAMFLFYFLFYLYIIQTILCFLAAYQIKKLE